MANGSAVNMDAHRQGKKICMCTTVTGTMDGFVIETAKYLHKQCGFDITLICSQDKPFETPLPDYLHYIPVRMGRGIDVSAISAILHFIRIFKEQKFDIVQYATPNASFYASIASRIVRVPIRLYCQWGIRYVGLSGVSRKVFKLLEKIVCRNSTAIRAVSPMNKAFAVSEGLYKESKALVIGKGGTIGVDLKQFDINMKDTWRKEIRQKHDIHEDDFLFGFCGRISVDKGCTELLSAFREMFEAGSKAKLVVIGYVDYNCGVPQDLLMWANENPNVIFTGRVAHQEIKKYFAAMDVLVHPTYREGFGMVLQEAGALGLAMITTKIPGASEVMEDGVSCMLVEPKNASELEVAMRKLSVDQELTRRIGQAAYDRTRQYYDRPIMLENQRRDYVGLLGVKGNE